MADRRVDDYITGFIEYARPFNAGALFTEWGAVWQLATAVKRQVGTKLRGQLTVPNLYVLMVAGPGSGKSQTVKAIRSILLSATNLNLIPASVTRAGLEDYMVENLQTRKDPTGMQIPSNECIALSDEMQGILPEHDISHLTLYNELYDTKEVHKARTRSNGKVDLQMPYCSIITGAQPAFLATTMPEQAWGMGFMSRSIMVFDTPRERTSAFEFEDVDHKLRIDLIGDLKDISQLYGYFTWEKAAKVLYETWWVKQGGPPVPTAKRLAMGYNARRDLHFFKLAMVFSLSRSNDLIVTMTDAARAIELLTRTEDRMRHIFTEMASTGAMVAVADVLDAVRVRCSDGSTMPEADLVHMLMQRFPATQIHSMIESLIGSGVIEEAKGGAATGRGFRNFVPGKKLQAL